MPRLRSLVLVLVLAAASALALAACDGDTDENNDYVDQVNEVSQTLLDSVSQTSAAGSAPDQIGTTLERVSTQLEQAATGMEEIAPPDDVADLHDRLVEQIMTLASEATNAADEVQAGGVAASAGALQQFVAEANRLGAEIDATIDEINSVLQD